jgi:hypothetical protein
MRPVFKRGPIRAMNKLMPPYDKDVLKMINFMLRLKS